MKVEVEGDLCWIQLYIMYNYMYMHSTAYDCSLRLISSLMPRAPRAVRKERKRYFDNDLVSSLGLFDSTSLFG